MQTLPASLATVSNPRRRNSSLHSTEQEDEDEAHAGAGGQLDGPDHAHGQAQDEEVGDDVGDAVDQVVRADEAVVLVGGRQVPELADRVADLEVEDGETLRRARLSTTSACGNTTLRGKVNLRTTRQASGSQGYTRRI